ncbi:carbonic anhydrase 1 [Drosophila nasuta]|uniref:carbonic anhydrase 1 n=1 Tax=Drosophila nasuta TaxID=42062 RepID=UPI00295EB389|nr:carbonic anhydrase 1 [Drosophila nasuta]
MFCHLLSLIWNALMSPMILLMDYAFESNCIMLLLSLFMSLALILNLKSASILLMDFYPTSVNDFLPSPINIDRRLVLSVGRGTPLMWHNYDAMPPAIMLLNNGSTVVMRISCAPQCKPHLRGSLLHDNYYFVEASFKWGGSEHTISSRRFALELQVLHAKNAATPPFEYVTISYLFVITQCKNESMQQITENLDALINAGSVIEVPPFDLCSLFWPFENDFYSYSGTYHNGTTTLSTQWLICASIFNISAQQVAQFGKLCNRDGCRIAGNSRALVPLDNRQVLLN